MPSVAQVFIQGDFRDAQALSNFVDAQLLLLIQGFGYNGRALGLYR